MKKLSGITGLGKNKMKKLFLLAFVSILLASCETLTELFEPTSTGYGSSASSNSTPLKTSSSGSNTSKTSATIIARSDPNKRANPDATNWDIDTLDTAKDATYLTGAEKDVILVDDGVSNRGHRNNILNKNFKYAGVSIGSHSGYTYQCVIDYANEYTDK